MALGKAVKPDPDLWLPLLGEYRLTPFPNDTLLEGTLRHSSIAVGETRISRLTSPRSSPRNNRNTTSVFP
jgi:hypothetical protein